MGYLKMTAKLCYDITTVVIVFLLCASGIVAYYLYIDSQIKKVVSMPEKTNKITIKILAAGFTMAYAAMLLPTAKETLDFQVYHISIELYALTKALLFLGMLGFGLITGGTYLSNFKGKQDA